MGLLKNALMGSLFVYPELSRDIQLHGCGPQDGNFENDFKNLAAEDSKLLVLRTGEVLVDINWYAAFHWTLKSDRVAPIWYGCDFGVVVSINKRTGN